MDEMATQRGWTVDGAQPKCKWHCPWCGDDTCVLGWGVVMHQTMISAKAADHHGCFGHRISVETRVNFMTYKVL
jgi:hypothetical protein